MTVSKLIERLKKCDKEALVVLHFANDGVYYEIDGVESLENDDYIAIITDGTEEDVTPGRGGE